PLPTQKKMARWAGQLRVGHNPFTGLLAEMERPGALIWPADFPAAREADWRKLVDAALKGGSFERLKSRTYDGLTIEPLYSSARDATGIAGRPAGTAWAVMQRVDHPDPAAANAQARQDFDGGATGLVLVFARSVSAH